MKNINDILTSSQAEYNQRLASSLIANVKLQTEIENLKFENLLLKSKLNILCKINND